VATALLGGGGLGVGLDDFTDQTLADPARLALAANVHCVADERAGDLFPRAFAAVLRVRTRSGTTLEHRVDSSRGGPEHPLSDADLSAKFASNASRALSPAAVDALRAAVLGLPARERVSGLLDATRTSAQGAS
jgi:2-methylcitrate dehydratase PrpD